MHDRAMTGLEPTPWRSSIYVDRRSEPVGSRTTRSELSNQIEPSTSLVSGDRPIQDNLMMLVPQRTFGNVALTHAVSNGREASDANGREAARAERQPQRRDGEADVMDPLTLLRRDSCHGRTG